MHLVDFRDPVLAAAVFCFVLYAMTPFINYYAAGNHYQALCVSMAMGVQNAMGCRPGSPIGTITTLMTGIKTWKFSNYSWLEEHSVLNCASSFVSLTPSFSRKLAYPIVAFGPINAAAVYCYGGGGGLCIFEHFFTFLTWFLVDDNDGGI